MSVVPNFFGRLMYLAKKASKPQGRKQSADEDATVNIPMGVPVLEPTATLIVGVDTEGPAWDASEEPTKRAVEARDPGWSAEGAGALSGGARRAGRVPREKVAGRESATVAPTFPQLDVGIGHTSAPLGSVILGARPRATQLVSVGGLL